MDTIRVIITSELSHVDILKVLQDYLKLHYKMLNSIYVQLSQELLQLINE